MPIDRKILLALGLGAALSGCDHGGVASTGPVAQFGDANRMTMMAQVIDPDPQYAEPLQSNADHAAQAVDRYRTDKVKKPERVRSTQVSGSGGSSGGSGGGSSGGGN